MNGWKIATIILGILLILETLVVVWAYNEGTQMIENELECANNICSNYDAYQFDDYTKVCYCFVGDEIKYQRYMK